MLKRGGELTEHILYAAKDVFLEMGFERASMDVIARRAETSKRTLYAHFENKEKLYFAVIDLVRGIFLTKLKRPGDYSDDPTEALVIFSGRYLRALLYGPIVRMCRSSIAEADRFPEGAAQYFDVIFAAPYERLSAYLHETFGLTENASVEGAQKLLGRALYPRFLPTLFGVGAPYEQFSEEAIPEDFDLTPVRDAVVELIQSLADKSGPPCPLL